MILLPKLDSRQLQPISKNDKQHLIYQKQHLQNFIIRHPKLTTRQLLRPDPEKRAPRFYLTDLSGNLINKRLPKMVHQFILNSQSPEKPLKKRTKHHTYLGPIAFSYHQQPLLLYLAIPNPKQSSAVIEWFIDNPLLLLLAALLISSPLCAFLAWHLTQPMRRLKEVAMQVADGELNTNFPIINNSEEITQLANAMQLMLLSVKNMLNNQQRLLSDISHELRSPLTRLGLALAINKRHAGESKELQRAELEVERIEGMISAMLNLSRIQLCTEEKKESTLDDFLDDLFLDAEFEAHENGKTLSYLPLENITITVYPELAHSAIENIIRNAIKYAEKIIHIEITISEKSIIITIKNDGPLIPNNELKNIFQPFYRLNKSRDRETGGVGLGLSIAENAMIKHGGKIWAENIDKQMCMHLQFPRF